MVDLIALDGFNFWQIVLVIITGFVASFIGNAVGSDGFIYLFGLEALNLSLIKTIGSMKWFSFINALYSTIKHLRQRSFIVRKLYKFTIPIGLPIWIFAAFLGSQASQIVSTKCLEYILPSITGIIAIYKTKELFTLPKSGKKKVSNKVFFYGILPFIFFYNGFFGPGGATFVIVAAAYCINMELKSGSILGRNMSLISGIPSVIVFSAAGNFYIDIAIITILAGILGTKCSMLVVKKYGSKFIHYSLILILYCITFQQGYSVVKSLIHP